MKETMFSWLLCQHYFVTLTLWHHNAYIMCNDNTQQSCTYVDKLALTMALALVFSSFSSVIITERRSMGLQQLACLYLYMFSINVIHNSRCNCRPLTSAFKKQQRCCDQRAREVSAQSFTLRQQATIEIIWQYHSLQQRRLRLQNAENTWPP